LMRAFREHREPKNSSTSVSIGQANLAAQQVVQQHIQQPEVQQKQNGDDQTRMLPNTAASTPALPTNAERIALPAVGHSTNATMGEKHRTEIAGREKSSGDECALSRPTVSRHYCDAKAGEKDD